MKHQIVDKVSQEIKNIGKLPKNIIKYGTLASFLLFLGAAIAFYINNNYFNDHELMYNSISLMKASSTIFAEIIIGGLLIDHLSKSAQ